MCVPVYNILGFLQVSMLLVEIMQDNPQISTVYTTGVFYFILMYMGSNVLPIGHFLHMSHMQQSFRAEEVEYCYISIVIFFKS